MLALDPSGKNSERIIDLLPQPIAVLNDCGVILSVNQAWRRFALENGASPDHVSEGSDYLRVCSAAEQSGDAVAELALKGLRAVLARTEYQFSVEYPCDTSAGRKWFLMEAARVEDDAAVVVSHLDITRQKNVEAALQESAEQTRRATERLAAALDASPTALFEQDCDLRYLWVENPVFGLSAADIVGKTDADVFGQGRDAETLEAMKRRVLELGVAARHEVEISDGHGGCRWLDLNIQPRRDATSVIGVLCTATDVTERKLAELALRDSQQRAQLATQATEVGVWELNTRENKVRWDAQMFRIYGVPPTEDGFVDYTVWENAVVDEQRSDQAQRLRQHADARGVFHRDFSIVRASDKQRREIHAVETTRIDGDGTKWVVGTNLDVTERNAAQRALLESEVRFRQFVQSLPQMVWSCERDGRCDYLSPRWVEYTGVAEAEQLGYGWLDRLHPDDRIEASEKWQAAVARGGEFTAEFRIQRHDGAYRWFQTLAHSCKDARGRVVKWFGSNTDITDHKNAEQTLKEADRRKDEFLAVLAHELRNPLAPIHAGIQMMQRSGGSQEIWAQVHEMMERQFGHLVRLVDDLLEISRVSQGKIELKKQSCRLADVLRHAIETSEPQLRFAGHEISVTWPTTPVNLDADAVRLVQVFANLLNNASKHTQRGGAISLIVEAALDNVTVCVRDTGEGIAPDLLPHVFELFTQADDDGKRGGLGVGLALARTIVELHGGVIEAFSEGLGKGSEIVVRLPATPSEPVQHNVDRQPVTQAASRRVVVIDDDRDVADSLAMLLELLGCDVRTAYSGAAGIPLVKEFRPSVIFLDLGMPDMNGYETARLIRAEPAGQQAQLVALTGWGQAADKARTREAGFDRHLVKPADVDVLEELIAAADDGRRE